MLMPPNSDDVHSQGYQLHIKATAMDNTACLIPLAKKRNLEVAQDASKDLIVIYRPMQPQK